MKMIIEQKITKKYSSHAISRMVAQLKAGASKHTSYGECLREVTRILPDQFFVIKKDGSKKLRAGAQNAIDGLGKDYYYIDKIKK